MVVDSDLGPRLRFPFELAAVASIVMVLTGLALREFVDLVDRAMVSEAPSMVSGERNLSVLEYAETGRWLAANSATHSGQFVRDIRMTEDGDWIATFSDDSGSAFLRGRKVVWRLQPASAWDANVFFWVCQAQGPDGSTVAQTSLPGYCKD